jgi:phage-related protein
MKCIIQIEVLMDWAIEFYDKAVKQDIYNWPESILAKYLWISEAIEQFGPAKLTMPHVRPMGQGLFEIRAKGKDGIGRALYCTAIGKKIVILNAFIKKTEKTPRSEIELAKKRMLEVKKNG